MYSIIIKARKLSSWRKDGAITSKFLVPLHLVSMLDRHKCPRVYTSQMKENNVNIEDASEERESGIYRVSAALIIPTSLYSHRSPAIAVLVNSR
jgi:hypothetical protein